MHTIQQLFDLKGQTALMLAAASAVPALAKCLADEDWQVRRGGW